MFPQYRARVQRETKIYECRHKSGEADAEFQRGIIDLPRSRVPCSIYTVSTSLRAYKQALFLVLVYLLEPTSSAKPKLPSVRKVEFMEARVLGAANLMCPVQGYPVPISR